MDNYNCVCCHKTSCSLYGIVISVLLGVLFGILVSVGLLTAAAASTFILITALVLVPVTLFTALFGSGEGCVCRYCPRILLGIAGAIIFSIIARFLTTVIGATLSAIFVGLSVLSLAFAISEIFCIVICLSQRCSELD